MLPTLAPGDRLLLLRTAARPRPGQLAVAPDPRQPARLLLKRVHRVADGMVDLRGDNPVASTDSRHFGSVPAADVVACAAWRYAPMGRAGRISALRAPAGRPEGRPPGRR
jgi:nickel-type superoxide dismutase maturation protease